MNYVKVYYVGFINKLGYSLITFFLLQTLAGFVNFFCASYNIINQFKILCHIFFSYYYERCTYNRLAFLHIGFSFNYSILSSKLL